MKYGRFESTEIEQFFFGKVDREGKKAVDAEGLKIPFCANQRHRQKQAPYRNAAIAEYAFRYMDGKRVGASRCKFYSYKISDHRSSRYGLQPRHLP